MKKLITIRLLIGFYILALPLMANAQTLQQYIDTALQNNPEISGYQLKYVASTEKRTEMASLPNTQIGAGYFLSRPETRVGSQVFKLSVLQMLPWFGTITARENYASALADADYEELSVAKRKLTALVAQSYYKLSDLRTKQLILADHLTLLKMYETMASKSLEAGKTSAVKLLKLQMRENDILQQQQVLQQAYDADVRAFNLLLNRNQQSSVSVPDSLPMPDETLEPNDQNLSLHPELVKYDKLYASVTQSELLNKKAQLPSFGVGLDYINVNRRTDMDVSQNGKDIVMPMVTLSIPIFTKKYSSVTQQNNLRQQQLLAQKQERYNTLETALQKALADRQSARIAYGLQQKNLQQARQSEHLLRNSYETATLNFNDVIDVLDLELSIRLKIADAVTSDYIQSTLINYLTK